MQVQVSYWVTACLRDPHAYYENMMNHNPTWPLSFHQYIIINFTSIPFSLFLSHLSFKNLPNSTHKI